jgi:hydroxyacylglutathione hydrolase
MLNRIVSSNHDICIVMSRHAAGLLREGKHYHLPGGGYVNRRVSLLLSLKGMFDKRWTHTFPPYQVREQDILVEEETPLSSIGIAMDGKIIETPGHSIDSISLVFDDGQCIVGDAAANFLRWAGTRYCIISIDNLRDYYASWEKLIAERAQVIHPSHGNEFRVEALKRNLGKHNRVVPFAR